MNPKFVIRKSSDDQFYFNLQAGNGKVILTSEMYTTKYSCENGIESVKMHAPDDDNYERETARNGKYYFNLKASNGKVIGTSEMYNSTQGRDNGIEAVKDDAPGADIDDQS